MSTLCLTEGPEIMGSVTSTIDHQSVENADPLRSFSESCREELEKLK
jgi:hypothetical protein